MFDNWLDETRPDPTLPNIALLTERPGARANAMAAIRDAVHDNYFGSDVLERMGFEKAALIVKESLPTAKKVQSGDLGELFATEYVEQRTEFRVALRRLRYKDDRDMPLRGDDVI